MGWFGHPDVRLCQRKQTEYGSWPENVAGWLGERDY
jgi:hypothetical protein